MSVVATTITREHSLGVGKYNNPSTSALDGKLKFTTQDCRKPGSRNVVLTSLDLVNENGSACFSVGKLELSQTTVSLLAQHLQAVANHMEILEARR